MIHAKEVYGQITGVHCDCGKFRSRGYILERMRGRVEGFTQNGKRLWKVNCTCGAILMVWKPKHPA